MRCELAKRKDFDLKSQKKKNNFKEIKNCDGALQVFKMNVFKTVDLRDKNSLKKLIASEDFGSLLNFTFEANKCLVLKQNRTTFKIKI